MAPIIIRVFATSSGVVTADEIAPASEPHAAPCAAVVSLPCAIRQNFFSPSYIGNWMKENGISRATVVQ